jgi:hypothetical protein
MFFVEESSGSSTEDESKLVAPNKLRFATKDSVKQIQPQLKEPESSLESGNASKAEGESSGKTKEMRKIQFVLCSTWHRKRFSKPE